MKMFTIDGKDYIVVTKAQLVALNILRGKTGKKMPAEHKLEKSGNDVVDSDVSEYVCILFFGAEKLGNETEERIRGACADSAKQCGEPCEPEAKGHLTKLSGDYGILPGRLHRPLPAPVRRSLRSLACAKRARITCCASSTRPTRR